MTAPQVLLVGKRNEEIVALKQTLSKGTTYEVELASIAQKAIQRLTTRSVDLCVFNFDLFTKDKIKLATDLRALGFDFPVLVLSRIIATDAYEAITEMSNTILLEKPFEQKDLWGVAEKLIVGNTCNQRHHRRFYTNQTAEVAPFGGGTMLDAKVFNLSRGGAYLEHTINNTGIRSGDMVQVKVKLNQIAREYNVNAKVVWQTPNGLWGTGHGLGVEFLRAKDVYRDLIHKL